MSVSKGIVELHEGRIAVFSDGEGLGSTFIVEIPISQDDAESPQVAQGVSSLVSQHSSAGLPPVAPNTQSKSGLARASSWLRTLTRRRVHVSDRLLRMLIVDDSVLNRKYLSRLLRSKCEVLKEAADGAEAVQMVQAAADVGASFDVVLMDNQMPVMDGPTATREIRAAGYKGLLLGITGDVLPAEIEHFNKCGADRVLAKPIDIPALEAILNGTIILVFCFISYLHLSFFPTTEMYEVMPSRNLFYYISSSLGKSVSFPHSLAFIYVDFYYLANIASLLVAL